MNENVLKKEFGKKDVTRLRNLMTGKHNNKAGQSVGYNKNNHFIRKVMFGKKMAVNGLLKMASNKMLQKWIKLKKHI